MKQKINKSWSLLSNMFHPSTLRARCHPRFGSGARFGFYLGRHKGDMHVSYALFAKKKEKEERWNFKYGVKSVKNINSNVSFTKLLILLQYLWFTMHKNHASNNEQVHWLTSKLNKSRCNNQNGSSRKEHVKTTRHLWERAGPSNTHASHRTGLLSVFHVCHPLCVSLWGPHLRPH